MRKKVILSYKKDGRLTQVSIVLNNEEIEVLQETAEVEVIFEENKILIKKRETEGKEEIKKFSQNDELIYFKGNVKLLRIKSGKDYISYRMAIPLAIVRQMKMEEHPEVEVKINYENSLIEIGEKNMGKVAIVKVNKGGVGKTFLTAQIGAGLALLEKKVLILTSDSQNNILNYLFKGNREFTDGLKSEVSYGKGEYFRLRKNLYFLPLENNTFGAAFLKEIPKFLEKMKEEYDFILIDSVPTLKVDTIFLECSDKIIIPAFCDEVTIEGILNVINETDIKKINCIVVNKFKSTSIQERYLKELKDAVSGTKIAFPVPISQLSLIEKMIDKKKTVWEYKSQEALKVQDSILEIIKTLDVELN